jgi:DME family drug/metabolite transporter
VPYPADGQPNVPARLFGVGRECRIVQQSSAMRPRLQILVAALCFGTTGTAQALASTGSAVSVGAARIAVGGGLLATLAAARGELSGLRRSWPLVLAAAAGVAGYQLAFFAAVRQTGVAVGTDVTIGSAAVLTGGAERLVEGTRQDVRWLCSTGLAVCGLALLAAASAHGAPVAPGGVVLALAAAAGYAGYAVLSKRLLRLGHEPGGVMGATFGLAGALLVPVLLATGSGWLATPRGVGLALYLGVVPTALAYLLYARGLRSVSAAETTTIGLAEPLTAAVLGVGALHERVAPAEVAGAALILAGLVALAVRLPRLRAPEPALVEP